MNKLNKGSVRYIVIHCSDTLPAQVCNAEVIDGWHRLRGFAMIGYHYVVLPNGEVEHGRPLFYQGAHVGKPKNYNGVSIGICYVGGRDTNGQYADTRTPQQRETLKKLIKQLKGKYPSARIVGHRDLDKGKVCPCFDAKVYNDE